ncbi:ubiquitin thioesterase zranb1 [Strongylocentrotus purpuratus]|uniref:ubiquitinyl hydrolase 1 n=1 Tax=Strongylocentrotus purpuratus TaxID=7668 RepID=A0A7M7THF0_STRPU|nr:ubiquitin thioesterase zranb1 [Strongylocentrotus purpuratus]|eukprot:XP_011662245.1 PREDICTED: ubiquitin thioesterase zranb1 isoform X2 [Strongylocentrotus purpuratus]
MTESHPKWTCEYCTYHNWYSSIKCTLCHAPKPVQLITSPTQDSSSTSLVEQEEQSDSSPRRLILPESDSSSPKWPCKACTYLNWPQAAKCALCHHAKGTGPPGDNSKGRGQPRLKTVRPTVGQQNVNNDRNRTICNSTKKWVCSTCTYENWPKTKHCALCSCTRQKQSPDPSVGAGSTLIEENLRNSGASSRSSPTSSPPRSPGPTISTVKVPVIGATSTPGHGTINVDQEKHVKLIRRRLRKSDWLFLNACNGVVDDDHQAVETYLTSGGNPTRTLTADEVLFLNRSGVFDVGLTLAHLALRFRKEDLLAVLLSTDIGAHAVKRPPSQVCPELAADIRREVAKSIRQRKGDFPCYFVTDIITYILPGEINYLPHTVRNQLMDELLDQDAQKELEQESPIINWSTEVADSMGSRLFALWNRTAGDCLLDSVLQATWGVFDTDSVLRRALGDSLNEGAHRFYSRWKAYESMHVESMHFSLDDDQWLNDWSLMLSLAGQPGAALEQTHIFALAHVLRRPIIVYGVKFIKSFRGENLGFARFQGVYLPLLWEPSFCCKSPIVLAYTRGHFSALVSQESGSDDNRGAGANLDSSDNSQTIYLPLTDSDGKLLPIHFITPLEVGTEERLLNEWLDCCYTAGGTFVAQQVHPRHRPVIIGQMTEEWLQRYRRIAQQI